MATNINVIRLPQQPKLSVQPLQQPQQPLSVAPAPKTQPLKMAQVQQPSLAPGVFDASGKPTSVAANVSLPSEAKQALGSIVARMTKDDMPSEMIQRYVNDWKLKYKDYAAFKAEQAKEKALTPKSLFKGFIKDVIQPAVTGPVKPFLKPVVSGIRNVQALANGGLTKNTGIEGQAMNIPGFGTVTPYAGSTNKQLIGNALDIGSNLVGARGASQVIDAAGSQAKSQIVKQAAGTGFKAGFLGTAGGDLSNNPDASYLGATAKGLGGGFLGAVAGGGAAAYGVRSKSTLPAKQTNNMVRAVKPKDAVKFSSQLESAAPDIVRAEQATGVSIQDIDSLATNLSTAKKQVWSEFKTLASPYGEVTIDGGDVATAIVRSIDKRYKTLNPAGAQKIMAVAETYRRPLTVDEAENFLESANKELHNYYAKNKVGRKVAAGDPEIAYTLAEADTLRASLNKKLGQLTGTDAAAIKRRYGALAGMEEDILRRQTVVNRANPDTLAEQIGYARGAAQVLGSVVRGDVLGAAEGVGQLGATKLLRDRNNTNKLINKAFSAFRKSVKPPKVNLVSPQLFLPAPRENIPNAGVNVPMEMPSRIQPLETTDNMIRSRTIRPKGESVSKPVTQIFGESKPNTVPNKVVQVVSSKGDKPGTFYLIPKKDAKAIINRIDGGKSGIAGKRVGGRNWHVTAKTPAQMEARGFRLGGIISKDQLP